MIALYQFPPAWGLPSMSPFCMKLETYLRMAGIPFESIPVSDPRKAPKGKLPYIEDDGKSVADSGFIIEYLGARFGIDLDSGLNGAERAMFHAVRRMIEEHLHWNAIVHARWADAENWRQVRAVYFATVPALIRPLVSGLARRAVMRDMRGHGVGRHGAEEVAELGRQDLSALSALLGDRDFLTGPQPTTVDATAFAFLAHILWVPVDSSPKVHGQALVNLSAYCGRMKSRYYGGAP